jgi:microcystin-dependent protein
MSEPFLGEIRMFSFNFPPRGWALCDGQLLPIKQHTPLYALLGTTFGGDGTTDFALPDLRGRVPLHQGNGYFRGMWGGMEAVPLDINQLPVHRHTAKGTTESGNKARGYVTRPFASSDDPTDPTYNSATSLVAMNNGVIGHDGGGGQPHLNIQPSNVINFSIALTGLFPPRS